MISMRALMLSASAVLLAGAAQAQSPTLLDLLFNQRRAAPVLVQPAEPPVVAQAAKPAKPKAAQAKRIEPPSFLNYVPPRLARFDPAAALPIAAVSVGTLGGFDLAEGVAVASPMQVVSEKPVTDALATHYRANPGFLWVSGFDPTSAALAIADHLADAASHGLAAEDYAVSLPQRGWRTNDMAARMAELTRFEFALSAALLRYVRDMEGGRIDPNKISAFYDFAPKQPDLVATLQALARSADPVADLAAMQPQEPEYEQLRAALRSLESHDGPRIAISGNVLIKPGQTHPELPAVVAALRAKADDALLTNHAMALAVYGDTAEYTPNLVAFVKDFQAANGLKPDGVIGSRTIGTAVDLASSVKRQRIALALEQMRWFPDSFGGRYVIINQPAFTATYYNNNVPELVTRTVVGTKKNQTYLFHDVIEYVEFNPTWGVPRSIIVNEFLPKLRGNPGWLDAQGYEVYDSKGQRISSSAVNWSGMGTSVPVSVIQPGGDGNALGDLKIMFPNKHSIYMHDTPAKKLFERDTRAYSHGCVRLQQPHEMAAKVLGVDLQTIEARLAQPTNRMSLKQRMPVFLAYFTAWPDDSGQINYFDDIYERDVHLQKAIDKTRASRAAEG